MSRYSEKQKRLGKHKKKEMVIPSGCARIYAGANNIIVSITNNNGDVLRQVSSGSLGFKGSRKGTPHAGSEVGKRIAADVVEMFSLKTVTVYIKGPGSAKENAIRGLVQGGLIVVALCDITPYAHNGCRLRKAKRC